jgi:hypothetical protein
MTMPSPQVILAGLTATANEWRSLAIGWHAALGLLLVALIAGWRPQKRLVGALLPLPCASVNALAWMKGNPFSAIVFAVVALVLALDVRNLPAQAVALASRRFAIPGAALMAFGWLYPHFLETQSWLSYAYAAPLGLLPCPTLAALIGLSLVLGMTHRCAGPLVLAAAGIFYGGVGVFLLDVSIDCVLIAGSAVLMVAVAGSPAIRKHSSRPSPARSPVTDRLWVRGRD